MQSVRQWLKLIIQKCETWYCHIRGEATDAEMQAWYEEQKRQQAQFELEEAELTESHRQYELEKEHWKAEDLAREEKYAHPYSLNEPDEEQLERDRLEELDREQEHHQYSCPWCGSRWSNGRCRACDRAFGRD